jgi:hypothetical protein
MRFVKEDVTRLTLPDGEWVDVKRELTVGEDREFRVAGMKKATVKGDIEVDFKAISLARVKTYLVGWSAVDHKGKMLPVTSDAIEALAVEDFEAIDAAILAHVDAVAEGKKTTKVETPTSDAA